jgi:hypothetical protein
MVEVKHVHRLHGCNTFVLAHQVKQVYYILYPCKKISAWWVVYRVNPHERLHTPNDYGSRAKETSSKKKKKRKILNILYISYYVLYISYYILAISYYVLYISFILHFQ